MANACKAFLTDRHKLSKFLSATPPPELANISRTFLLLQEARHRADYDTSIEYTLKVAIATFRSAYDLFEDWEKVRNTEDARVFLVALLLWKDLRD